MGIRDEDIARVRAATDIVGLIGEYVQLKQVGQRYRGLCPFHAEKTGSFYVNAVDGLYHCFGCQASGDAITFVREQEHLGFVEAVERLASKVGMTLTYDNEGENRTRAERKRLIEIVEKAEAFYHQRLLESPDAAGARKYLRSRGFDSDEVKAWKLGWAPDDWDQLVKTLKLSKKDLEGTGLGAINSRGRPYDFFRGRLLFPIHDSDGHALGFGGRIMPGKEGAKYMNTRQTPLYDKSRALFALAGPSPPSPRGRERGVFRNAEEASRATFVVRQSFVRSRRAFRLFFRVASRRQPRADVPTTRLPRQKPRKPRDPRINT